MHGTEGKHIDICDQQKTMSLPKRAQTVEEDSESFTALGLTILSTTTTTPHLARFAATMTISSLAKVSILTVLTCFPDLVDELAPFIHHLVSSTRLHFSVLVVALRLLARIPTALDPQATDTRRVFTAAYQIAMKSLYDVNFTKSVWVQCTAFSEPEIMQAELALLDALDFNTLVCASEFFVYMRHLDDLATFFQQLDSAGVTRRRTRVPSLAAHTYPMHAARAPMHLSEGDDEDGVLAAPARHKRSVSLSAINNPQERVKQRTRPKGMMAKLRRAFGL